MKPKTFPIILIILGAAFLLGAILFVLDNATASEPVGLGKWIFDIFVAILGTGTGIKGWLELRKTSQRLTKMEDTRIQEVDYSPDAEQSMHGKGGSMKQTSKNSPRSKQKME